MVRRYAASAQRGNQIPLLNSVSGLVPFSIVTLTEVYLLSLRFIEHCYQGGA